MNGSVLLALAEEGSHGGGAHEEKLGDVLLHHIGDAAELWGVHLPSIHLGAIDLSITRLVVMMWIATLSIILVIRLGYKPGAVPRGLGNFIEMLVVFVRDEIVGVNFGPVTRRYTPYFLTLFFFILFMNLLGLIPFMITPTGNLNITGALALCTLLFIHGSGMRLHGVLHHWRNQIPPGIPLWLYPVMIPVELISMLTKPFALMVRLFANMTAGHIVIMAMIAIIIDMGTYLLSPAIVFPVAISMLEIFIAFLQTYIFVFLSAIFVSSAVHGGH